MCMCLGVTLTLQIACLVYFIKKLDFFIIFLLLFSYPLDIRATSTLPARDLRANSVRRIAAHFKDFVPRNLKVRLKSTKPKKPKILKNIVWNK